MSCAKVSALGYILLMPKSVLLPLNFILWQRLKEREMKWMKKELNSVQHGDPCIPEARTLRAEGICLGMHRGVLFARQGHSNFLRPHQRHICCLQSLQRFLPFIWLGKCFYAQMFGCPG